MKYFKLLLLSLSLVFISAQGSEKAASSEDILHYIVERLPEYGILEMDDRGFVYVDVDDDYILRLVQFIKGEGFEEPPYFDAAGLHGAHITVMRPGELKCDEKIKEAGQTVYFNVKECQIVKPPHWTDVECIYIITVEAPYLDKLREKYGLPKLIYDFHITIGVKKSVA